MIPVITSGLKEVACTERQPSYTGVFGAGMFTVRRKVEVKATVADLLASIMSGVGPVEFEGIKIGRPEVIQITMRGFKRWEFSPNFPVSVSVMGADISVDISSMELIQDNGPALLVTTASNLKPDLLIGFTLAVNKPEVPVGNVPDKAEIDQVCSRLNVPVRYRQDAIKSVAYAWGPNQIAQTRMMAVQGPMDEDGVDRLAKVIVQELVDQRVVSAGLFFWMQLGYWLVKIISALIQARGNNG